MIAWERRLAITGSVASILGFLALFVDQRVIRSGVTDFLLATVPVPVLVLALGAAFLVTVLLWARGTKRVPYDVGLQHVRPTLITSANPDSATAVSSDFLKSVAGGVSTWVLIGRQGEGIRKLDNNRYLFAHATHSNPYKNVFAFCLGPTNANANSLGEAYWKLWLVNPQGQRRTFKTPASPGLQPGWHHFVIRWLHSVPKLEVLIDGKVVIHESDYREFWPRSFTGHMFIGAWAIRDWAVHFADTRFWRTQILSTFPDDEWVMQERQISPNQVASVPA